MPSPKSTTKSHSSASKAKKPAPHPAQSDDASFDAIQLLMDDHKAVKKLFKAYDELVKSKADDSDKQNLAQQICTMLKVHTAIEEEIFYPAAREALKEKALLDEAIVEHASAKELISQIESMNPDDAFYDAKVTVLSEYIDHHVKEEESEMFPKAKQAKMDLDELGDQLSERKDELMADAQDKSVH